MADRLLEGTETLDSRQMRDQVLDDNELERERGITIKLHAVRMSHRGKDGRDYEFNLIDTPGHVDFTYEVSRSLAACEGAILVVDATQGIQAQTLSNLFLALDANLEIIPVINKVDLPGAEPERRRDEVVDLLGVAPEDDRDGCLQDIHWYFGAWGYFPTYTLGALAAAQFYDAATDMRLGAEWAAHEALTVRGGVGVSQRPYADDDAQNAVTLAVGMSTPLAPDAVLDVAYVRSAWDRLGAGVEESFHTDRVVVGARILF